MTQWPEDVAAALQRHEVVAITSGITDLREAAGLLDQTIPGRWQRLEWGMGSAENRARFHALQRASGFHMLPMFVGRDGVIGGLPELRRHLAVQVSEPAASAPDVPWIPWLGYGGLVPFLFLGASAWFGAPGWQVFALHALAAYGAVILSFLGAIHWGAYLANREHRAGWIAAPVWAVLPALAGWLALLLPPPGALSVLALLFLPVLAVDRSTLRPLPLPPRYITLRGYLTLGATLSLLSGAFASLSLT